jgi:hypothetical protein
MVQSWCDCVKGLYGVDVFSVHCILYSRIHLADFMFLLYMAQSRQSARLFLKSSELGPPDPSTAGECVPPSFGWGGGGGGGHTRLRVRGLLYGVDVTA